MELLLTAALLANAVVVRPVANMYSAPSEENDVVSQAIYGTNIGVLEEKPGWARIRTPDDYTGWVPETALRRGPPYGIEGRVARVESLFAHLYREPDVTRHAPVLTVPYESRLEVVSGEGRWLQVRLPADHPAWVQSGDLSFATETYSIPEAIAHARRFLGLPYTWGGTSSFGYDCSGFTQMLVRRLGAVMPRDAQPQADWSGLATVDRKDLRPGDLLYFGSSVRKITHTGMYIGDGKFINATTYQRPMVKIDELEEPHWRQRLVACRRLK